MMYLIFAGLVLFMIYDLTKTEVKVKEDADEITIMLEY